MLRLLFFVLGFLFMGIGILGIFLPVLPTTPLLLLSLWCFSHSSPRWREWLLANKYFGEYLDDYFSGRGITLRNKVYAISMLWITLSLCAYGVDILWLRILFLCIAVGVTIHLSVMKTRKK